MDGSVVSLLKIAVHSSLAVVDFWWLLGWKNLWFDRDVTYLTVQDLWPWRRGYVQMLQWLWIGNKWWWHWESIDWVRLWWSRMWLSWWLRWWTLSRSVKRDYQQAHFTERASQCSNNIMTTKLNNVETFNNTRTSRLGCFCTNYAHFCLESITHLQVTTPSSRRE